MIYKLIYEKFYEHTKIAFPYLIYFQQTDFIGRNKITQSAGTLENLTHVWGSLGRFSGYQWWVEAAQYL